MDELPRLRGRFGRPFTFIERCASTQRLLDAAPEGAVVAGNAVAEAVAVETGLTPQVKHPNDVLIRGRKVAGVLAEASEGRVVLGVGVNVSQTQDQLPSDGVTRATSLALEGAVVDRAALLAAVLERLEANYDRWVTSSGT